MVQQLKLQDYDAEWMEFAIDRAHLCDPVPSAFNVGAALIATSPGLLPDQLRDHLLAANPHEEGGAEGCRPCPRQGQHVLLSSGYSRELPGNTHAEEVCFLKLQALCECLFPNANTQSSNEKKSNDAEGDPISVPEWHPILRSVLRQPGIVLYTTMEPCSKRLSGRPPCVDHTLALGIPRVVMGIAEPRDIFVHCVGQDKLIEANVECLVLPGVEDRCWEPNRHIRPSYRA